MEADLMVSCPYNPAHRIRKAKLMSHVAKCKKSSKIDNKVSCPLDTSHIVDRDQLEEHIISCPGLANLITDVDCLNADQNAEQPPPPIDSSRTVENWDEEPEVPSYNPMEISENRKVLRSVAGLSKSERRKFRNKERMRIAQLNAEDLDASVGTSYSVKDADTSLYSLHSRRSENVLNDASTSFANNLDKSFKQDASMQTNISHEFDDPFHRTLYNEFAPENDNLNELLEQSLHHAELFNKSLNPEVTSAKDNSHMNKEKQVFPNFGQHENTKIESDGLLNTSNLKQEKSECTASASVSCERDDLLTLLKNLNAIKTESTKELHQNDKDLSQKEWDEMFDRFNILTNVQNAAAEESAQLLQQLSKLKLRQEVPPKK